METVTAFVKGVLVLFVMPVLDHKIVLADEITDAELMLVFVFVAPLKLIEIVTPLVAINNGP